MFRGRLVQALWKTPPLPPVPHHPGRRSAGVWKAAAPIRPPAPSHTPWKTLRVFHSPPATATSSREEKKHRPRLDFVIERASRASGKDLGGGKLPPSQILQVAEAPIRMTGLGGARWFEAAGFAGHGRLLPAFSPETVHRDEP